MTKLLLSVLLVLFALNANAQDKSIAFTDTNGVANVYALTDVSKINFIGDMVNLTLTDGSTFSWDMTLVSSLRYQDEVTGVNEGAIADLNSLALSLYPNPTSDQIELKYTLINPSLIDVQLFDLNGAVVANIFNGNQVSGDHQLQIDLKDLNKGIYVCQIEGEGFVVTKQIVKD